MDRGDGASMARRLLDVAGTLSASFWAPAAVLFSVC